MAVLAAYTAGGGGSSLADYLSRYVFADAKCETVKPGPKEVEGFDKFVERYIAGLSAERAAVESFDGR